MASTKKQPAPRPTDRVTIEHSKLKGSDGEKATWTGPRSTAEQLKKADDGWSDPKTSGSSS